MTIKELRERDAARLAARIDNPTPENLNNARHAMRLYYLFVAAYQRSFYTEQDRNATRAQKDEADAKSEKAHKRALDALKPYGVRITCPGLYPYIEEIGTHRNFTSGHFYN